MCPTALLTYTLPMKMLGNTISRGPGGKHCVCCYPAPGTQRKKDKRAAKRRETLKWQRLVKEDS